MVHYLLYLFEGTRCFALIAAGQFPNRMYKQRHFLRPSRMEQKCNGTSPGWRCPICWISSYILSLKGSLSPGAYRKYYIVWNLWDTPIRAASSTMYGQFVDFYRHMANKSKLLQGVLQGYIFLASFFFKFKTMTCLWFIKMSLFAVGIDLMASHKDLSTLIQHVNTELVQVFRCFSWTILPLFIKKTSFIIFSF